MTDTRAEGWTRTSDLNLMRVPSYQLLHLDFLQPVSESNASSVIESDMT